MTWKMKVSLTRRSPNPCHSDEDQVSGPGMCFSNLIQLTGNTNFVEHHGRKDETWDSNVTSEMADCVYMVLSL